MAMNTNPDNDIVVVKEALDVAGAVSYWRAGGEVSINALRVAWLAAGLDEKLIRKPPEDVTALRRAVMEQQERHRLVRGLRKGEWAIVDETVHKVADGQPAVPPKYTTIAIVRAWAGSAFAPRIDYEPGYNESTGIGAAVMGAYARQQGVFDPSDMTGWLVDMAYKQNAVTLRESGGVYFLPKAAMDFWNKAAGVIETVSNGTIRVFRIPAMKNSEAIAAITDAINHEAAQIAAKFEEELLATGDDALGKRAIATRQAQATELAKKLASYEELIGVQTEIASRLEKLNANLAAAALMAMGDEAAA